jgi:hypothetical protein
MFKIVFILLLCAILSGCVSYGPGYYPSRYNHFKKYGSYKQPSWNSGHKRFHKKQHRQFKRW